MSLDEDEQSDAPDASVLSPDELDITDDENVAELDDGRYLISPDAPPTDIDSMATQDSTNDESRRVSEQAVYDWLSTQAANADATYGFDITAKFDSRIEQQKLFSNDVTTTFENLLVWYAQYVGGNTPVEDVIGILLSESNVSVRYPTATIVNLLSTLEMSSDDTIEELLSKLSEQKGVRFPPTTD